MIFTRGYESGIVVDLGHVAIYAGGGMEVVAPHTGALVRMQTVSTEAVQAIR